MASSRQICSAGSDNPGYPRNCWWVAATAAEVTRKPLGRWLLDTPIALYRTEAGEVAAIENRCLHRWAPLSQGYLEGDTLVCPYHGARFGTDGRCLSYPSQDQTPEAARLRIFTVVERGPFVWIWLGSETAMEASPSPPDCPFAMDPQWTVLSGSYSVQANYMLVHENLLDLTHFTYLHRDSFMIKSKRPPRYWVEGNAVRSHIIYDFTSDPDARAAAGIHDPAVMREEDIGAFASPACHLGSVNLYDGYAETPTTINQINHFLTPESGTRTHYWWHFCVNHRLPPEVVTAMRDTVEKAFAEDLQMLSAIQETIDRDPRGRNYIEMSFQGDMGGLQARRALDRILAAEVEVPVSASATAQMAD